MDHPQIAQRGIAWKTCTRVRWAWIVSFIVIANCCHTWGLWDRVCVVLLDCSLPRRILAQVTATLSEMSDVGLLLSFYSNPTSIMLILLMRMILTTLLVNKCLTYQMLIDYTCIFRICCKPIMLITVILAKTCLKVIKGSYFRLMSSLFAWSLACLECDRLVTMDQSC
jgi:hypothetical protein